MDGTRFDAVLRSLFAARSRRDVAGFMGGLAAAAPLAALLGHTDGEARKKKKKCKKCGPCRKCQKGKCRPKPNGTECGGLCEACQGGACVSLCPDGQVCLVNGGCAVPCAGNVNCFFGPTECTCGATTEGQQTCRVPVDNCVVLQDCANTTECPQGRMCQQIAGCAGALKCVGICMT